MSGERPTTLHNGSILEKYKSNICDDGMIPSYIINSHNCLNKTREITTDISPEATRRFVVSVSRRMVRLISEYTRRWYER